MPARLSPGRVAAVTLLCALMCTVAGAGVADDDASALRPTAGSVVPSRDGSELFNGSDFNVACYSTPEVETALHNLGDLAEVIQKSGRRVVFTVAPNKSLVDSEALRGTRIPLGRCARQGLARQRHLLKKFDDPHYLPISELLAKDHRQLYWRQDTHWTTLGASVFATKLAGRLDPRVRRHLRFDLGSATRRGDLAALTDPNAPAESAPAAFPGPRITVTGAPVIGTDAQEAVDLDYHWGASPRGRTIRGRTVLIGDSFSFLGMSVLRPLFAHGHFLWGTALPRKTTVRGIVEADTVVIQVVQRFLPDHALAKRGFRTALTRALALDSRKNRGR